MDVVEFLARAGQDAGLAHCSLQDLLTGPLARELAPEERELLAGPGPYRLSGALDAQPCCLQFPAEEEGENEREPEPDTDEQPFRDGE